MGEAEKHIETFIRQVIKYREEKIIFDKKLAKESQIREYCHNKAREYLGNDMNFLDASIGRYISDLWTSRDNKRVFKFFDDNTGEKTTDFTSIEGATLFYWYCKSNNLHADKALGLLYYVAGVALEREFNALIANTKQNRIKATIVPEKRLFGWVKCPQITRNYMMNLSVADGYTSYYLERPFVGHLAYLMKAGYDVAQAEAVINRGVGIFYSFLPLEVESYLLPKILGGVLPTSFMDGIFAQDLMHKQNQIEKKYRTVNSKTNYYNEEIKPAMIEITGMLIGHVNNDLAVNGLGNVTQVQKDEMVMNNHLSEARYGVLIKNDVPIEKAFPTTYKMFKPAQDFMLKRVANGSLL